jgi:tetratricopeptide (TPR) repeat protein
VRNALIFDDIEALEATHRTPKAHRRAAATLTEWAEQQHPDDEVTPADLLSAAAWHLGQAGDTEASLELYHRAVDAEGTTTPDARCLLHAALLEAGRLDEARQVADDFRRSHPRIADCADMAESFHLVGDLEQAHRWAEMGVNRLELDAPEDADDADVDVITLLNVRRQVRQELGFPPDDLDELGP